MKEELIAPCGLDCAVCMAYLRKERKCPGCHGEDKNKSTSCINCIIKNCETIRDNRSGFCFECLSYPCKKLKQLDKRYRTRYFVNVIQNLEDIRDNGLAAFVEKEKKRWRCPECGGVICMHKGYCYTCGKKVER
jgi:hypothetical protein